jgi:hypothetical protein
MSQVLGAFGLLDFTVSEPILALQPFETYEAFVYLILIFFFRAAVSPGQ